MWGRKWLERKVCSAKYWAQSMGHKLRGRKVLGAVWGAQSLGGAKCGGPKCGDAKYGAQSVGGAKCGGAKWVNPYPHMFEVSRQQWPQNLLSPDKPLDVVPTRIQRFRIQLMRFDLNFFHFWYHSQKSRCFVAYYIGHSLRQYSGSRGIRSHSNQRKTFKRHTHRAKQNCNGGRFRCKCHLLILPVIVARYQQLTNGYTHVFATV